MNRDQTQVLKGVAIILMLFLHLFNQADNVDLCHNLIYIGGEPLALILSRASNPVAFFLVLGGYGMYKVYEKGDRHRWTRVFKLYLHYWLILAIFLIIGHFIAPGKYPGSVQVFVSNVTSYEATYNGEMWFLLPYVCLTLLSPLYFKAIRNVNALIVVAATLLIHLSTSFCISRYGTSFLYHNYWAYDPLLIFHLLFNFSLGAMAARSHFFERLAEKTAYYRPQVGRIAWGGVIVCISISCIFKYNFFYAFMVITCLNLAYIPHWLKSLLTALGKQSMNMWMIHTWFCYYLFHSFIYSFSYPLLILAVLIIISYLSGLAIDAIAKPIERKVFS